MEITNVVLEREDEKWLEKVPISPYPINRSRFSAMINMVYFYTHNIGRKIISSSDIWRVFWDNGFIAYDAKSEQKYFLSSKGEGMLELKGSSLLVKEEGQKYFLAFIRENLQTQGTKKKRRKKA